MAQVIQKRGINRPSAAHLTLPLVERHSHSYGGAGADNVLTIPNTTSTLSTPTPLSSASIYSQASYIPSPAPFSEDQVDQRRFGIATTPLVDGPWTRPTERAVDGMHNADVNPNIFVLDLHGAAAEPLSSDSEGYSPASSSGSEIEGFKTDIVQRISDEFVLVDFEPVAATNHTISEPQVSKGKARMKRLRTTSRVIGKVLSRLSLHSPSARAVKNEEHQPVPTVPPQIFLSLPSPGLEILSTPKEDRQVKIETLVARHRSTLPSTWKPHRPPSPLPKGLRRYGKHKRTFSSLSLHMGASPPPPLPTNAPRVRSMAP
ncbi:hypothetical protein H0H81_008902 [Sphagnurus paluster]|uniref:Uncharacterized protein n=1 Tax=Sphagnurus paluster TaxID=117069 RepID=A0A9P7GJT8_9AGAR|nr:hypothetical protein H0H81_008902 [Sphagnurus paluster]